MDKRRNDGWVLTELNGRVVQLSTDEDGDKVAKYVRPACCNPHPDRGATSPHPVKHGHVIDWIFLISGLILFACLWSRVL